MKIIKKILSILLRISISVILLIFLFRQVDKQRLFEIIRHSDKPLLFLSFCIFSSAYVLGLLRWEMLLKAVNIHLPLKRVIISFSGGLFFNLFLPSTIGGDLMRSLDLAAHTNKPKEVIATVLLDRLSGYVGLVFLALLAMLPGWSFVQSNSSILFSIAIITAILISVLLILFNKFLYSKINKLLHSPNAGRLRQLLKDLHDELHYFKYQKRVIINNLIVSVIIQAIAPITFFMIALSFGLKINIIYFFIFLPIIGAITLLPISIGGLGLRDATTIFFFAKVGVGRDLAFAMSLLSFSFILICSSLGGLIYVLTIHHRRIQPHKPQVIRNR